MNNAKSVLCVGAELVWDGEPAKVTAITASAVQLAMPSGLALVAIPALVTAMARNDAPNQPSDGQTTLDMPITGVPNAALEEARQWMRHVNEVFCGFPTGIDTTEAGAPPKHQYDPATTELGERVTAKAAEIGVTERTVWRKLAKREDGLLGMLDRRSIRALGIEADPAVADRKRKVRDAISAVLDSLTLKSNVTKAHVRELTKRRLDEQWGNDVVPVPPERTFNRLVGELATGRSTFGSSKARRSIANRPTTHYGTLVATRPGEFILFDSTRLDVFALDPVTGSWVRAELTIALDLFTRAVVAYRLTHTSTKAVDAALMLHDVLSPKVASANVSAEGRWNYVGVPQSIVLDRFGIEDSDAFAGVPVVEPETAVIDRGKVYVSDAFLGAAHTLGVNVILARPRTPTDKPQVERFFRTIREGLLDRLPGYKGHSVWDRGENIENDAVYTLDELSAIIGDWIATVYHRRPHSGLHIWSSPHVDVSPNDMYEAGLMRAGFIDIVRDESILYSLLPTVWGTIQHYGFDHRGIRYDSAALNDYRKPECPRSPYGGKYAGKWPFRYDPRDVSKVWFQDPYTAAWHEIPWHGAEEAGERVFDEALVAYAKKLMLTRGAKGSFELADTICQILERVERGDATRADLREVAKSEFRASVSKRDRDEAPTPSRDDPPESDEPNLTIVSDDDAVGAPIIPFTRLDFGAEHRDQFIGADDDVDDFDDDEETINEW